MPGPVPPALDPAGEASRRLTSRQLHQVLRLAHGPLVTVALAVSHGILCWLTGRQSLQQSVPGAANDSWAVSRASRHWQYPVLAHAGPGPLIAPAVSLSH